MLKDKKNYNILIVEDNLGDFTLIEDYLEERIAALQITHVQKFNEAKELILANNIQFDIALLDLSLPDKSGEELVTEILQIATNFPVIILTGYTDVEFSIQSISKGIADYLLKDDLNAASLYKSVIYCIERRKRILQINESEKKYSDLFQLSPQPMWVYDLDSLYFLDVNAAAIKHYGYSREEFLLLTLKEISPYEAINQTEETTNLSGKYEPLVLQKIVSHRKKNSELIQVDVQDNEIIFKGKKAKIALANDITERLNYIEAIEKQNKKLQEIAWTQSHEVRAPLAKMMGLIDLIKNHEISDAEKNEFLSYILNAAEEFDTIIKEIVNKTEQVTFNIN